MAAKANPVTPVVAAPVVAAPVTITMTALEARSLGKKRGNTERLSSYFGGLAQGFNLGLTEAVGRSFGGIGHVWAESLETGDEDGAYYAMQIRREGMIRRGEDPDALVTVVVQ